VRRAFTADGPNRLWCMDVTQHRTGERNDKPSGQQYRSAQSQLLRPEETERYLGATAINITRLDAYVTHQPLDRTHSSQLIRLQAATTN
jgi:transposase InsO family protein